jgi:cyclophilin family peptidyl-prolyl cis-trans isomerase
MANAGPNTNGSQFFFITNHGLMENIVRYLELLPFFVIYSNVVFGEVVDSMDIVKKIEGLGMRSYFSEFQLDNRVLLKSRLLLRKLVPFHKHIKQQK